MFSVFFFFEIMCILYCRCTGISFHLKFVKKMSKRKAILELHRAGRSNPEIVKLTKASKSTIRDTVHRLSLTRNIRELSKVWQTLKCLHS